METKYIEKQAALDIVNGWRDQLIPTYGENDEYVKCLETVAEHLELFHAADVRPVVRGKWIKLAPYNQNNWKCSCCHKENKYAYKDGDVTVYELQDFFCPNCGADMRGGDAE